MHLDVLMHLQERLVNVNIAQLKSQSKTSVAMTEPSVLGFVEYQTYPKQCSFALIQGLLGIKNIAHDMVR